ncbi:hypothetical protein HUJ05_009193 [Dendroctonus ponderosae]|nr:hypothetical protein HUJ05_009193 [Dendroctonus ponderosae]
MLHHGQCNAKKWVGATRASSADLECFWAGSSRSIVRTETNGGAWCPATQATPDTNEFIEVDLKTVHMITATETQGRFGNGQGVEFAEAYMLEFYRPRLQKWKRYRTKANEEEIKGNINTYLESKTILDPPIWASKVRFLPYSSHMRTVCMRVELYGCRWSDGVVSYSMPQGDKKGTSWEFYDFTYDGHWDGEKLKDGLGQLTDGQTAPDDFKMSFHEDAGQGWIGWKSDNRENHPVEITFEFDKVREFSSVNIYTNNQFTKEVQVFSETKVFFSVGGRRYKGEPITYESFEDKIMETPRNVSFKLHHRIGRFVKLQLFFAARWILISEVTFESSPVSGNFSGEEEEAMEVGPLGGDGKSASPDNKNVVSAMNDQEGVWKYLGIVMILIVGVLVVVAIALCMGIQHRRRKNSSRPSQIPDKTHLYRSPSLGKFLPINFVRPVDSLIQPGHLTTSSSDYVDYAEPLQQPPLLQRSPPDLQHMFPSPPSGPPPSEQHYAATDLCKEYKPHFSPPPPPFSTPPPVRLQRQPRFVNGKPHIGP